jgi:hypothetical protein
VSDTGSAHWASSSLSQRWPLNTGLTVYIYVGKTICIIYGIINNINTSYHYFIHLYCQYEKEEFCHIYRVWKLFIILFSVT